VANVTVAASLLGVPVRPEALEALASAVQAQLGAVEVFEALDVQGELPLTSFDPRWHD
jgi:hypothetical protein